MRYMSSLLQSPWVRVLTAALHWLLLLFVLGAVLFGVVTAEEPADPGQGEEAEEPADPALVDEYDPATSRIVNLFHTNLKWGDLSDLFGPGDGAFPEWLQETPIDSIVLHNVESSWVPPVATITITANLVPVDIHVGLHSPVNDQGYDIRNATVSSIDVGYTSLAHPGIFYWITDPGITWTKELIGKPSPHDAGSTAGGFRNDDVSPHWSDWALGGTQGGTVYEGFQYFIMITKWTERDGVYRLEGTLDKRSVASYSGNHTTSNTKSVTIGADQTTAYYIMSYWPWRGGDGSSIGDNPYFSKDYHPLSVGSFLELTSLHHRVDSLYSGSTRTYDDIKFYRPYLNSDKLPNDHYPALSTTIRKGIWRYGEPNSINYKFDSQVVMSNPQTGAFLGGRIIDLAPRSGFKKFTHKDYANQTQQGTQNDNVPTSPPSVGGIVENPQPGAGGEDDGEDGDDGGGDGEEEEVPDPIPDDWEGPPDEEEEPEDEQDPIVGDPTNPEQPEFTFFDEWGSVRDADASTVPLYFPVPKFHAGSLEVDYLAPVEFNLPAEIWPAMAIIRTILAAMLTLGFMLGVKHVIAKW